MQYVGCTITSFRLSFNNHKSSLNRYGQGIRNINGQHLYEHFFGEGHWDLSAFRVQIIDITHQYYQPYGKGKLLDRENNQSSKSDPLSLEIPFS
jgi:hypothetical protein